MNNDFSTKEPDNNINYINGVAYSIKYNLVRPCICCGAACLGTYLFWYIHQGKLIALETEQDSLDSLCDEIICRNLDPENYELLPTFIQEMNECRGWQDQSDGAIIDLNDFLLALDAIEQLKDTASDPEHIESLLISLRNLTRESITAGSKLWVMDC